MTDEELVAKKLAQIEGWLVELRALARPELLERDVKERRYVEHTLQIIVQGCQDVASHVVSDERLGEPRTNQELFGLLAQAGWIDEPLAQALRRAVGFRNVLVHGYAVVEPALVRDVLVNHLGDVDRFVSAMRRRMRGGAG
jgi:uncharacterized protein YutE (UPF0331/DUF86 family)